MQRVEVVSLDTAQKIINAAFVAAAMLAGLAGALYVPQVGIINPGEFSPLNSIEIAIWVAVGGRGTLYGAALGAIVVNLAKTCLLEQCRSFGCLFLVDVCCCDCCCLRA